ncbi:MAG: bifunctional oligoribonuclease/PAP phosphatase NrnA [Bacteroidales bacterium]|nr:bifunctional oligoribonuclease/PAP phosphatase NrnA [Bacteroidales bacterium]
MQKIEQSTISQVKSLLVNNPKILIITHNNPDGDALGSTLGLFHCLKNQGFWVAMITPNDFPEFLQWMPGNELIVSGFSAKNLAIDRITNVDLIFCLDFNQANRLASLEETFNKSKAKKILIDHHPNPGNFPDICISDVTVSSCAEKVWQLMNLMDWKKYIDLKVAECIFAGIMTDTGAFSFNSSTQDTYKVVSELLDYGVNKDRIFDLVYNNFSADRMRLLGYCLEQKMKVFPEYKTAFISITKQELNNFNFKSGDTEGFVNYPLSIKGIKFAALFIENKSFIKASFRSKGAFNVNELAKTHFEGGGHINAAGGEFKGSMEENNAFFEGLLPSYKNKLIEE